MKVIMYGTEICIDCVNDKKVLVEESIELDYRDITKDVKTLKEFLKIRDKDPLFDEIKDLGKIGIPLYILEDGRKTFDITDFLSVNSSSSSCSIDGTGC